MSNQRKYEEVGRMSGQTSEIVLCLLPLIENGQAGLPVDALAADVIAACARFNIWLADQKKEKKLSEEDWMQLLELYEETTRECQASVRKFSEGSDRKELTESLSRIATKLNRRLGS